MLNNWENINNKPYFGTMTANSGMNTSSPIVNNNISAPAMAPSANSQALSNAASDNFIGNRINEYSDVNPLTQFGLSIPIALAINAGMDKYLQLYDGEYSKTLAGKIGNFGDNVSNFFTQSKVGKFFAAKKNKVAPFLKKNIYDKSGLLRAFDKTPTSPELELVKNQMNMATEMSVKEYFNAADEFFKPLKSAKDLDSIGASAKDIERIENLIKTNSADKAKILLEEQFKILNPGAAVPKNITEGTIEELKLKALNWTNKAEYDIAKANQVQNRAKVLDKLKKMKNKNLFARIDWSDANNFSKASGIVKGRKMPFERIYNIMLSSSGSANTMHKTPLGRQLNKVVNLLTEGVTGRMFNGKISTLLQAFFVAEALLMASKQETAGDKFKSFAERMTELAGFFVFIGPSIKLMHKIGGLKYSGMTPAQVKTYENAVAEFNKKVAKGFFKNETAYNLERLRLKNQYRPKTKNPITWLGRKVGDIISTGLKTTVRPYSRYTHKEVDLCINQLLKNPKEYLKNIPVRLADVVHNPRYWFKRVAGWPIRFAIPMMLIMPFFNKIAVKGCHAIFGKPKYSILDKDKYEKQQEKAQELEQQKTMLDTINAQRGSNSSIPSIKPNNTAGDTNLIKIAERNKRDTQSSGTQTSQVNNTSSEPERTYIPNPAGLVAQGPDMSNLDKALAQADKTEQEIQNILKMQ